MKTELTPEQKEKNLKTGKKLIKYTAGIIGLFVLIGLFVPKEEMQNLKHARFYPVKTTDVSKVRAGILAVLNGKQPYKTMPPSPAHNVREVNDSVFTASYPVILEGSKRLDDSYEMRFIIHRRPDGVGFSASTDLEDATANETVMSAWAPTMQEYIDGNS